MLNGVNGVHILIIGCDNIYLLLSLSLKYVLHVPKLSNNLISVEKLTHDLNCYITFRTHSPLFFFYQQWINKIKRDTSGVSQPIYKTISGLPISSTKETLLYGWGKTTIKWEKHTQKYNQLVTSKQHSTLPKPPEPRPPTFTSPHDKLPVQGITRHVAYSGEH